MIGIDYWEAVVMRKSRGPAGGIRQWSHFDRGPDQAARLVSVGSFVARNTSWCPEWRVRWICGAPDLSVGSWGWGEVHGRETGVQQNR